MEHIDVNIVIVLSAVTLLVFSPKVLLSLYMHCDTQQDDMQSNFVLVYAVYCNRGIVLSTGGGHVSPERIALEEYIPIQHLAACTF